VGRHQVRTEFLVILLAVMCFAAPEVEARLREAAPNRGRAAAGGALPGATQTFALAQGLPEQLKVVSRYRYRLQNSVGIKGPCD
jgi:hypothetical protein